MKQFKATLILQLIAGIFIIGCENKPVHIDFIESDFLISEITQNSMVINYKINANGLKIAEILYSNDSTLLVLHSPLLKKIYPVLDEKSQTYKGELTNLEYYTKYWIQISYKDFYGDVTYSKVYSAITLGFNLRSLTPKIACRDLDLSFVGDNVDQEKSNYIVLIGNNSCPIETISRINNGTFLFSVKVPTSASYGKAKVIVNYKNKSIFSDEIEIYKGEFKNIGSHPTLGGFSNSFGYKGWIYVYYFPDSYSNFWKYNPILNTWVQLSNPNITPRLPVYSQGYEIENKIYFPPFTCTALISPYCQRNQEDEKYIYSYDPELNLWERHKLVNNDSVPVYSGLYSSFVYENKLFCFIMHNNANDYSKIVLKMFDPVDYSWTTVVDSVPFENAEGCVASVVDNNIYVMPAIVRKRDYASIYYRNELYLFDLQSKTFIKKSIWEDPMIQGSKNAHLVGYNGHLFYYGGEFSTGYWHDFWSNSYEYFPETDKWVPLASCYINFGNQNFGGFLQSINDRIFIGFGWSNLIYEFLLK